MRAMLFESPELDVYGHMALDEAFFAAAEPDLVALRFYRWPGGLPETGRLTAPKGVTFGYFQEHEEVVRSIREKGLSVTFPVARRMTGGGIVYHDGDVTFSLVFPWSRLVAASWIYKDLHRAVHLGLKAYGIPSRLWSPPQCKAQPAASCFAGPSPMDLVHEDGTKFLGGALRRRDGAGLYQGSLRMEGFSSTRAQLVRAVVEGIGLQWKSFLIPEGTPPRLVRDAERLRRERYETKEWNHRR
ncbi:MAG: hypothetical protein HY078_09865 [Elusimicrobia bacterium]|nr:hypothetical protein [Elusimicrobiota bacterium]